MSNSETTRCWSGARFRLFRLSFGMTQEAFADACKESVDVIRAIENAPLDDAVRWTVVARVLDKTRAVHDAVFPRTLSRDGVRFIQLPLTDAEQELQALNLKNIRPLARPAFLAERFKHPEVHNPFTIPAEIVEHLNAMRDLSAMSKEANDQ